MKQSSQSFIPTTPNHTTTPNYTRNNFKKTPDSQTEPPRKNKTNYCWNHGADLRAGKECKRKARVKKEDATLANRMGDLMYVLTDRLSRTLGLTVII